MYGISITKDALANPNFAKNVVGYSDSNSKAVSEARFKTNNPMNPVIEFIRQNLKENLA
jgi:hypothetical protein